VHGVRAHETNEFEEAMRFFRELLQSAQKKTAISMRTAFFDRPTKRVILSVCFITGKNSSTASSACTVRDLLSGRVEIFGEEAQCLAGLVSTTISRYPHPA
jgi:hypothetical protein